MTKLLLLTILTYTTFATTSITSLLKKYGVKEDQIGISILNKSGKEIYKLNENTKFIPASTFKIISAYYILKNSNIDKSFETSLSIDGKIEGNTLEGNLVIHSEGNPFFLSSDLIALLYELKNRGVTKITGTIKLTGNLPELMSIGDVGLDDQSYNQGISSFNLNFNRFRLFNLRNGSFLTIPYLKALNIVKNHAPMTPGEILKRNYKSEDIEEWHYQRSSGNKFEIPIRNTKAVYLSYVENILNKFEITFSNNTDGQKKGELTNIARVSSPPIKRLVELALEYSNNLFIETLMLHTTKAKNLDEASKKISQYLMSKKLITEDLQINRASGLSTKMEISPRVFSSIISKIYNDKIEDKFFFSYLSLAGSTGFLAKNYLSKETFENFYAKTGSLDYINNICGLWIKGEEKFFCIMINDKKLRVKLDGPNSEENEDLRQTAKKWKNAKDQLLEELISVLF